MVAEFRNRSEYPMNTVEALDENVTSFDNPNARLETPEQTPQPTPKPQSAPKVQVMSRNVEAEPVRDRRQVQLPDRAAADAGYSCEWPDWDSDSL